MGLYQKLGSPEIKTLDDYLKVSSKCSSSVRRAIAASRRTDFRCGRNGPGLFDERGVYYRIIRLWGRGLFQYSDLILTKADEAKWQGVLDDNGYYLKGVKFFFDANKMGLLDPDSLTQKYSDVTNKYKDGQILFAQFPWVSSSYNTTENTSSGKGFALVPFGDEQMSSSGFKPQGGTWYWSIGAKTKYPERVMQFLNWLYTPEGVMASSYGPKGLIWDIKDGKPTLTDFGYKAITNSVNMPDEYGGGLYKDGEPNQQRNDLHVYDQSGNWGTV